MAIGVEHSIENDPILNGPASNPSLSRVMRLLRRLAGSSEAADSAEVVETTAAVVASEDLGLGRFPLQYLSMGLGRHKYIFSYVKRFKTIRT